MTAVGMRTGCSSRIGAAALRQASGGPIHTAHGGASNGLAGVVGVLRCTAGGETPGAGQPRGRGSVYAARLTVLQHGVGALGCPRNSLTIR